MSITESFSRALAHLDAAGRAERPLLPSRLATACTAVLPVDGAGICLFNSTGIPIPIGASDHHVQTAERLQFTAGQGPCLDAHSLGCTVIATESLIAQEWPMYYHSLVTRTRLRAVTAVPLTGGLTGTGAVEFYFQRSHGVADLNMIDANRVVATISELLIHHTATPGPDNASWAQNPTATARCAVFIAMGLLTIALHVSDHDALTLLRARAYATDRSVDDIAADLLHHRITTADFRHNDNPG